jgi:hypothetical protein
VALAVLIHPVLALDLVVLGERLCEGLLTGVVEPRDKGPYFQNVEPQTGPVGMLDQLTGL